MNTQNFFPNWHTFQPDDHQKCEHELNYVGPCGMEEENDIHKPFEKVETPVR